MTKIDRAKADEIGLSPFTVYIPKPIAVGEIAKSRADDEARPASSAAERKASSRKAKEDAGFKQINVDAPDDEAIRSLIRTIARRPVEPGKTSVFQALGSKPGLLEMVERILGAPVFMSVFQLCESHPDFLRWVAIVAEEIEVVAQSGFATTQRRPVSNEEVQDAASVMGKMLTQPEFRRLVIALGNASTKALEATDFVLADESLQRAVLNTTSHFESQQSQIASPDLLMAASLLPTMLGRMDITNFLKKALDTIPDSEVHFPERSERVLSLLKLEFQKDGGAQH